MVAYRLSIVTNPMIMYHLSDKHISIVIALDTYFGEFGVTLGVMPFSVRQP